MIPAHADELAAVINRLRRAQGQIGGVLRMIEEGRDCREVLTQVAAVSRALDRAGFAILANGMRTCLSDPARATDAQELERTFLSLA
jgi:DNA-binding FrmR family transcriptional regulator